jgi:5-methylcytosine-specific restriction endonuclease McrA
MRRHAAKLQRTPQWVDLAAVRAIYEACPDGMEVDHILPLRGDHVSGLHVAENLQYLTQPENRAKGNR